MNKFLAFFSLFLFFWNFATAHPAQFTRLAVEVHEDGFFRASLNIDILAFALCETSQKVNDAALVALLDGPRSTLATQLADAGDRFRREVVIRTVQGNITIPNSDWVLPDVKTVEAVLKRNIIPRTVVPGEIEFTGKIPPGAKTLAIRLPYLVGENIQIYELPGGKGESAPVAAGEFSSPVNLNLSVPTPSLIHTIANYIVLGFEHIIPQGIDHILFVLGLFLLSIRLRPLLWQISAFTLAHSFTLALSIYGLFSLPPKIVEPIIAASIVFIAMENIFTTKLHAWRPLVVFVFGLLHGMGFAGVLSELGLPNNARLPAIVGFNIGVECGQLAVIALAFLAVGWAGKRVWYHSRISIPASLVIALVALYWTVERVLPSHS